MTDPEVDPRISGLDGIARQLAIVAGYQAAVKLMLHFGGQRLYVPDKMRPSSPFWRVLGGKIAKLLPACAAQVAGPDGRENDIYIPTGSRLERAKRKAAIATFPGSKNKAASQFHISRRTVQRYRRRERDLDLFSKR